VQVRGVRARDNVCVYVRVLLCVRDVHDHRHAGANEREENVSHTLIMVRCVTYFVAPLLRTLQCDPAYATPLSNTQVSSDEEDDYRAAWCQAAA
jgi:hypothetical protein